MRKMFSKNQIKELSVESVNEGIESGSVNATKKLYRHIVNFQVDNPEQGDVGSGEISFIDDYPEDYTQDTFDYYHTFYKSIVQNVVLYVENGGTLYLLSYGDDGYMNLLDSTDSSISEQSLGDILAQELSNFEDEVLAIN